MIRVIRPHSRHPEPRRRTRFNYEGNGSKTKNTQNKLLQPFSLSVGHAQTEGQFVLPETGILSSPKPSGRASLPVPEPSALRSPPSAVPGISTLHSALVSRLTPVTDSRRPGG